MVKNIRSFFILLITLNFCKLAIACSCLIVSTSEHFKQADSVIIGKLIEHSTAGSKYKTLKTFKGEARDDIFLPNNFTENGFLIADTCQYGPSEINSIHLLFIKQEDKGNEKIMNTSLCSGNREFVIQDKAERDKIETYAKLSNILLRNNPEYSAMINEVEQLSSKK